VSETRSTGRENHSAIRTSEGCTKTVLDCIPTGEQVVSPDVDGDVGRLRVVAKDTGAVALAELPAQLEARARTK
jgi:hypothetical protein